MDAADYLTMVRRFWRSILLLTVAGGLAGLGVALVTTPVHTSSAKLLFVGADGPTVQLAVQSYAELAETEAVLAPVAGELGVDDYRTLEDPVSTEASLTSQLVTVSATDEDAAMAARIANAVAETVVEQAETTSGEVSEDVIRGTVVESATAAEEPSSPSATLYAVGGALVGLLAGLAQALARFWRSRARSAT